MCYAIHIRIIINICCVRCSGSSSTSTNGILSLCSTCITNFEKISFNIPTLSASPLFVYTFFHLLIFLYCPNACTPSAFFVHNFVWLNFFHLTIDFCSASSNFSIDVSRAVAAVAVTSIDQKPFDIAY